MTSLGLSSAAVQMTDARAAGGAWLKRLVFPGVLGVTAGLVLEFFRLLQVDPKSGMDLLRAWGPGSLIELIGVVILGGLLSQLLDISRQGVGAQRQMAEAMGRLANKDDRQIEEIRTLQNYTATQMRRLHEHQQAATAKLEEVLQHLKSGGKQ